LDPLGSAGVARYLASSAFEGVGETLAKRIVETLGNDALRVIRESPQRLAEVKGLKAAVRDKLARTVREEYERHHVQVFLRGLGLGPRQARSVAERFGDDTERVVRADPYTIAGAVAGLGFATADRIALALGFAVDGPERTRAALLAALRDAAGDGHSLLDRARLWSAARELVGGELAETALEASLAQLDTRSEVLVEGADETARVYLPHLAASEAGLAASVRRLLDAGDPAPLADLERVRKAEGLVGMELDEDQRASVVGLLAHPLALLTGGPGVGKTTIVRLVVELAEHSGARVLLASPTGRAAKRLSEATGRAAATLHRTLGFEPATGRFQHDREHPLETDLVIVDEVSMLDVVLAHHLLKAVRTPTRLVLVGDPDQLPSVGPGNVLRDLIDSGCVPCFRLRRIHRQERGSLIIENAHRILDGVEPALPARGDVESDFYVFPEEDPARAAERVVEVTTQRIGRTFGLDWLRDVQVLAPMYRGECGVDSLNERLRAARGERTASIVHAGRAWRVGDRVIQTRNDYEREVFNGDMGLVEGVHDGGLTVAFPDQQVGYALEHLSDLQLAFAITVHRAQGSEYPAVVLPLMPQHYMMLQRNLLYTAVTRARRLVVLVGSRRALRMALENAEPSLRLSGLTDRLRGADS
ncbi:MAG TPA: ATP-dependent RecD-like DNA helicase, partial [Planctomycetota bacterium]|nr:ATP-dependent RecD-like DNA helicase [Planctomycetota bacterium]